MAKAHDRILKIEVTADESDDTLDVTAVEYFRDRGKYDADEAFSAVYSDDGPLGTVEITFGEVLPPPTHIVIESTFQA
jgi:hypothetical protein